MKFFTRICSYFCNIFKLKNSKLACYTRKINIKKRLLISFSIIPMVAVIAVGAMSYSKSKDSIHNKTAEYLKEMLAIIDQNITLNLHKFESLSDEIIVNTTTSYGLENYKRMNYDEKSQFIREMDNLLSHKFSLLSSATEVELVSSDLSIIYTQGFKYFKSSDIEKYSEEAKKADGKIIWFYALLNGEPHIAMARQVQSNSIYFVNGYLFVAIKAKSFAAPFENTNIGKGGNVAIIDNNGNVLISQQDILESGSNINNKELVCNLNNNYKGTIRQTEIKDKKYLINYKRLSRLDWSIVSMVPSDFLNNDLKKLKRDVFTIAFICFIAIIFISLIIYDGIYGPLNKLVKSIDSVKNNKLDIRVNDNSDDELGILSRSFDEMLDKIEDLIEEVKLEQDVKRDMELRMLQAQINPHFLFNTLNSLKWVAVMSQDYSVSEGLGALSMLLRNTIIDKNELITIDEEIENIKNYVIIQKIRYGDSFDIEYNVDKKVGQCKIIKFLLQPIIENAIIHGFDEGKLDQMINVNIFKCSGNIVINIKDNGKGFDSSNRIIEDNKKKLAGIGVKNISDRIKLTFGEEYDLYIDSTKGIGTEIKIIIPFIS